MRGDAKPRQSGGSLRPCECTGARGGSTGEYSRLQQCGTEVVKHIDKGENRGFFKHPKDAVGMKHI